MTKSAFVTKLSQQFTGFKAEILADIGDFVGSLSEDNIGKLWDAFEVEYLLQSPPRKGHVLKIASQAGIYGARQGDAQKFDNVCYLCASQGHSCRFSVQTLKCPTCGSTPPWVATGYAGVNVSQDRAREIVDANPKGPHPTLNNSKEATVTRKLEAIRQDRRQLGKELADAMGLR